MTAEKKYVLPVLLGINAMLIVAVVLLLVFGKSAERSHDCAPEAPAEEATLP